MSTQPWRLFLAYPLDVQTGIGAVWVQVPRVRDAVGWGCGVMPFSCRRISSAPKTWQASCPGCAGRGLAGGFLRSGLSNEPVPQWPQDYDMVGEMDQAGTEKEALGAAFRQCHAAGTDMNPGDVVGLDDGTLWRCEVEGWTDIGKQWRVRVQNSRERAR